MYIVKRTGSLAINARGANTSYTISHDAGTCGLTLIHTVRFVAGLDAVAYGGDSATLISTVTRDSFVSEIWGVQNSKTGVNNITITAPNADWVTYVGATSYGIISKSATFPNVQGTGSKGSGDGVDTVTVAITTTVDDCFLVGLGMHSGLAADSLSPGAGTAQVSQYNPGTGFDLGVYESDPLNTGSAGSHSLEITLGATNQSMTLAVVALAPSLSRPKLFRKPI